MSRGKISLFHILAHFMCFQQSQTKWEGNKRSFFFQSVAYVVRADRSLRLLSEDLFKCFLTIDFNIVILYNKIMLLLTPSNFSKYTAKLNICPCQTPYTFFIAQYQEPFRVSTHPVKTVDQLWSTYLVQLLTCLLASFACKCLRFVIQLWLGLKCVLRESWIMNGKPGSKLWMGAQLYVSQTPAKYWLMVIYFASMVSSSTVLHCWGKRTIMWHEMFFCSGS